MLTIKWEFDAKHFLKENENLLKIVTRRISKQIWRNVALYHLLNNGCSVVNGCRQNESKQLIKHHNNTHEEKACVFHKSIIKVLKGLAKIQLYFSNIYFFNEERNICLVWIRGEICTDHLLQDKTVVKNSSKKYILVDFDVIEQQEMDFFTGGSVIMNYELIFCPEVTV